MGNVMIFTNQIFGTDRLGQYVMSVCHEALTYNNILCILLFWFIYECINKGPTLSNVGVHRLCDDFNRIRQVRRFTSLPNHTLFTYVADLLNDCWYYFMNKKIIVFICGFCEITICG